MQTKLVSQNHAEQVSELHSKAGKRDVANKDLGGTYGLARSWATLAC